jgi:hypothetical protein
LLPDLDPFATLYLHLPGIQRRRQLRVGKSASHAAILTQDRPPDDTSGWAAGRPATHLVTETCVAHGLRTLTVDPPGRHFVSRYGWHSWARSATVLDVRNRATWTQPPAHVLRWHNGLVPALALRLTKDEGVGTDVFALLADALLDAGSEDDELIAECRWLAAAGATLHRTGYFDDRWRDVYHALAPADALHPSDALLRGDATDAQRAEWERAHGRP